MNRTENDTHQRKFIVPVCGALNVKWSETAEVSIKLCMRINFINSAVLHMGVERETQPHTHI